MVATRQVAASCLAVSLIYLHGPSAARTDADPSGSPPGAVEIAHEPDPLFDDDSAEFQAVEPIADPLEEGNRAIFQFNQKLDDWLWSPITRAYRFVAPEPVRTGIRRALNNLNTPVYVANHVLQLRLFDAGQAVGAFALNSTLGILGIFEPGREAGWEIRPADFGQTLGLVGFASGPYVVVPVFGPTTVRDAVGSAVDYLLQPLNYLLGIPTQLVWGGGAGLTLREEVSDELAALEKSSIDFYSVMRSAYVQSREKSIDTARERRNAGFARVLPSGWRCGEGPPQAAQD